MNTLDEIIYYCKEAEPAGALMLSGEWGCGKTYLIDHELREALSTSHFIVRISLFGMGSINELNTAIKREWVAACGGLLGKLNDHDKAVSIGKTIFGTVGIVAGSFLPAIKEATDAALAINPLDYVTIKKEIEVSGYKKRVVLVFDDLERSMLDTISVLGCINEYCENQHFNTIIVANEDKVKERERIQTKSNQNVSEEQNRSEKVSKEISYTEIKEKIVARTVYHKPEYDKIISSVIFEREWFSEEYKKFLLDNKKIILGVFESDISSENGAEKPHNIRSLKCALQDFHRLYEVLKKSGIEDLNHFLTTFIAYMIAAKNGIAEEGEYGFIFSDEEVKKAYPFFSSAFLPDFARQWILYGDWDEDRISTEIEEIAARYNAKEPKDILRNIYFNCVEDELIQQGFSGLLEYCYSGDLTLDEYVIFIQNSFLSREYGVELPEHIDWVRVCYGIQKRFKCAINNRDEHNLICIGLDTKLSYSDEEKNAYEMIRQFYDGNQLWYRLNELLFIDELKNIGVNAFITCQNKMFDVFSNDMAEATAYCFDNSEQPDKACFQGLFNNMWGSVFQRHGIDRDATKSGLQKLIELLEELANRYLNEGHKIASGHAKKLIAVIKDIIESAGEQTKGADS